MKSSVGIAVRMSIRMAVLLVDFAVGVTVAVAVGVTVAVPVGDSVAVPVRGVAVAGAAIRVSVTVPISFKSIGSSSNLHNPFNKHGKRKKNR